MSAALGGNNPILGKVRAQGIDLRGSLTDEQVTGAMQHENALGVGRFDRNEAHRRSPHGFANRLSIGRIILVPLH